MSEHEPGLSELLRALVQVGRIAEAMLVRRETVIQSGAEQDASNVSGTAGAPATQLPKAETSEDKVEVDDVHAAEEEGPPVVPPAPPSTWRDSYPSRKPFFTKHAATRLMERYGVRPHAIVPTMAALSHQIHGTHLQGIEAVNLGQRPASDGIPGTIWAVDIYRQVGFVVVSDDETIVTVLPRDAKQLQQLNGPQRAALEAFRTELLLRHAAPVALTKYHGRGGTGS